MDLFDLTEAPPEESNPPSPKYSDPGRVLFYWICTPLEHKAADVEILSYDSDSSLCWMQEGVGIDYVLENELDLELDGYYVCENITGEYYRGGRSWGEDDDEEWYLGNVRRASEEEIQSENLT